MNRLITLLLLGVVLGVCDQFAVTEDGQKVLLKDDGTWVYVISSDSGVYQIPEIMSSEDVDTKPKPIHIPKSEYPESARREGIQGIVMTRVLVDTNGSVIDAEIKESSGNALLDAAALKAVKKAKFTPAKHKGKRVKVWVQIPMRFTITK